MYLPAAVSNNAVKKTFMEFSEVHTVFAGCFKETDFKGICYGKRHIRLTPFKSKHDLPHEIQFPDDDRYFIIDTRPSYTNRVEVTGCPEGTISEINVIAKTKHRLSLQTMLRQHQALMMLWSFQTRMVLQ